MKNFSIKKFLYYFFGVIFLFPCLIIAVILAMGNDQEETRVWLAVFTKEDLHQ